MYDYDSLGRLVGVTERGGSALIHSGLFRYDKSNRVSRYDYIVPGFADRYYEYGYDPANGNLSTMKMPDGKTFSYTYDVLQRLTKKDNGLYSVNYTYLYGGSGNNTTTMAESVTTKNAAGGTLYGSEYTYDELGNITMVISNDHTGNYFGSSYVYDNQNQLTREIISVGGVSTTYNYSYDSYGNIRSKAVTAGGVTTTKTFTYGNSAWRDLLTAYNGAGIIYDNAGNPTSYYDGTSFTWTQGRRLASASNGGAVTNYMYSPDGLRLSKTVAGTTHNYTWQDGKLLTETYGTTKMEFMYDESGSPSGIIINGSPYYYVKNLQGDVVQLLDASGTVQATYTYNAWGEVIASTGVYASINPIRYRGYYQDYETGFYYLQSRYYDPVISRFINADSYASTGQGFLGLNMFAYCNNNPVSRIDVGGEIWKEVVQYIGQGISNTFSSWNYAFAEIGQIAIYDGPYPILDVIAIASTIVLGMTAIGVGVYEGVKSFQNDKAESKSKAEPVIKNPSRRQAIFPVNPFSFAPKGLKMVVRSGSYNGRFISWMAGRVEIFRWDEDNRWGSHYHIINQKGMHYWPGTPVPEPYNSIYF